MVKKVLLLSIGFVLLLAAGSPEQEPDSTSEQDDRYAAELERTPDDPRLHEPGKLTVATGDPVYPPWMMDNDPAGGEGFENGIVYALAEEMGFEHEDVQWVSQTFDEGIAPGPKPYDFAIQQYSVTEARAEIVDFSMVYYQPEKAVVALGDSPVAGATSFEELRDARWGATIGTTDLDYLENVIGVEGVAVYDDQAGTFQALQARQIDRTVVALPTALFATAVQVPEAQISAILPGDPNDNGHGLLFEQDSELIDWVNDSLESIIEQGVIDDLTEEYLIPDDDIPEISD